MSGERMGKYETGDMGDMGEKAAALPEEGLSFVELLTERRSLWEHLAATDKPILLYGMGDGADKIIDCLATCGRAIDGVFASDDFVRGQDFRGHRVRRYAECCELYPDFIVLVAFGTQLPEVVAAVQRIAADRETYAPNVPLFGGGLFDYDFVCRHEAEFAAAYGLLADEASRRTFVNICNYSISGRLDYLLADIVPRQAAYELLELGSDEVYVDLGAYNGDTIREFVDRVGGRYRGLIAVEPDPKNFRKLSRSCAELPNLHGVNEGIWSEPCELGFASKAGRNSALTDRPQGSSRMVSCTSLDCLQERFPELPFTYIKLDVEGVEAAALAGGSRLIARQAPKLMVSAYHRNEDIFRLPLLLHEQQPDYRFYLRRHLYIPAWDLNYIVKL